MIQPRYMLFAQDGSGEGTAAAGVTEFKVTHGMESGSLGGSFAVPKYEAFRQPFEFTRGQVVVAYLDAGDTPAYRGWISDVKRSIAGRRHEYELRGLWDRLADVRIVEATSAGSEAEHHPELATAGAIALWLATTLIAPAALGITIDAALIACTAPVAELVMREGMSAQEILHKLAYMGTTAGNIIAAGVGANGKLFFNAAGGTVAKTVSVGVDVLDGTENPQASTLATALVLKADVIPTRGYAAKRTFSNPNLSGAVRKTRLVKLAGVYRQADLQAFATGYFERHGVPYTGDAEEAGGTAVRISGIRVNIENGVDDILFPQAGKLRYEDPERELAIEDYCGSIELEVGRGVKVTYNLGLSNENDMETGAGDPFAPSLIDSYAGGLGNPENLFSEDINQLPEADELSDLVGGPDENYPHLAGPLIDDEGGAGSKLVLGAVFDLMCPGGMKLGDTLSAQAEIANGGTSGALSGVVHFYYQMLDSLYNIVQEFDEAATSMSAVDGLELWRSTAGFRPVQAGWIRVAVKVALPGNTKWYPADIGSGEIKGAKLVRVLDGLGDGEQLCFAGWPANAN